MDILLGCEMSGIVRDAFIARGHNAVSCDLLPSERTGPHMMCDIRIALRKKWDMGIFFPPCTYLCASGLHWNKRRPERQQLTEEALEFVRMLLGSDIPKIGLENPIGCISSRIRKPDQIIQPWMFGHPESKATCLWLKGLPKLVATNILQVPPSGRWNNQTASGQNKLGPSETRWIERSRTYQGVADAMAEQWG